ncbi:hypothetical protein [Oryza sativa Japonica Group]|uniref:Uncharacterized protein n=1 Tax=Oryza sativa subsp. japonica TaxID=39947 RepID=Q5NAG0_ORYSJ|nr:hypothetical protein [Oryza sativa Japonica Group]BAD81546.1 hypothetical protein [Oryza sativa Japonica Group]
MSSPLPYPAPPHRLRIAVHRKKMTTRLAPLRLRAAALFICPPSAPAVSRRRRRSSPAPPPTRSVPCLGRRERGRGEREEEMSEADMWGPLETGGATAGKSGGGGGGRARPRQAKQAGAGRWPARAATDCGRPRQEVGAGSGRWRRNRGALGSPNTRSSLSSAVHRARPVGRTEAGGMAARGAALDGGGRAEGKRGELRAERTAGVGRADEHCRRMRGPQRRRWPKEERAQRGGAPQQRERTELGKMRLVGEGERGDASPPLARRAPCPSAPPAPGDAAAPPAPAAHRPHSELPLACRHARPPLAVAAAALTRRHRRSACSSALTPPLHLLQSHARPSPPAAGKERGEEREEEIKEKKKIKCN